MHTPHPAGQLLQEGHSARDHGAEGAPDRGQPRQPHGGGGCVHAQGQVHCSGAVGRVHRHLRGSGAARQGRQVLLKHEQCSSWQAVACWMDRLPKARHSRGCSETLLGLSMSATALTVVRTCICSWMGKGVSTAVQNANDIIGPALIVSQLRWRHQYGLSLLVDAIPCQMPCLPSRPYTRLIASTHRAWTPPSRRTSTTR
jgi:hypothetical protein